MRIRSYLSLIAVLAVGLLAVLLLGLIEQPAQAMSLFSTQSQAATATPVVTFTVPPTTGTPAAGVTFQPALPALPTCVPVATAQPITATSVLTSTAQSTTGTVTPSSTPICIPASGTLPTNATPTLTPTEAVTATLESTPSATSSTSDSSTEQPGKVDMNKIFPPGPGKDLVFSNCTGCHSFVCSIIGQRTADAWNKIKTTHRKRVSALSDADFGALFDYLAANFNDQKPVPELPPELAQMGCSAQ